MKAEFAKLGDDFTLPAPDGFRTGSRCPLFVVVDALMENLPDQTAQSVSHGPNGLLRPGLDDQPAVQAFEKAALGMGSGMGCLV